MDDYIGFAVELAVAYKSLVSLRLLSLKARVVKLP